MEKAFEKLKWSFAFSCEATIEEFVELGQKRGCKPSWAYRAYAARLDMLDEFQRHADRMREALGKPSLDEIVITGKSVGAS